MISPPLLVESALQTCRLMEFLKNLTLPSAIAVLTPPGCLLRTVVINPEVDDCPLGSHGGLVEIAGLQ